MNLLLLARTYFANLKYTQVCSWLCVVRVADDGWRCTYLLYSTDKTAAGLGEAVQRPLVGGRGAGGLVMERAYGIEGHDEVATFRGGGGGSHECVTKQGSKADRHLE